jgi:hypothetical protein
LLAKMYTAGRLFITLSWIPAFAGMTSERPQSLS